MIALGCGELGSGNASTSMVLSAYFWCRSLRRLFVGLRLRPLWPDAPCCSRHPIWPGWGAVAPVSALGWMAAAQSYHGLARASMLRDKAMGWDRLERSGEL